MKREYILLLAGILLLSFTGCGRENPFNYADSDLSGMEKSARDENSSNKEQKNDDEENYDDDDNYGNDYDGRSSSSSKRSVSSSSSYRSSSSVNSSNSNPISQYAYITTSMTLNFTLTHYKQRLCSMEGKGSKTCNYADGDPKISFKLIFIESSGDSTTYSTNDKLGKKWFYYDDTGEWDGEKSFTVDVPTYTQKIRVCPTVLDDDFALDDDMSSGYCYNTYNVGLLGYREVVYQSDYENQNCELEWEWYLY